MQLLISTAPDAPAPKRGPGRPPGATRVRAAVPLDSLAAATAPVAPDAIDDALRRIWFSGFCAGAMGVAPERVKRWARCDRTFVVGDRRAIYCGARCRNTVMKRRYHARLRARQRDVRTTR